MAQSYGVRSNAVLPPDAVLTLFLHSQGNIALKWLNLTTETVGSVIKTVGSVIKTVGSVIETVGSVTKTGGSITETGGSVTKTGGSVTKTGGSVTKTGGSITKTGGSITETGGSVTKTGGSITETGGSVTKTGGSVIVTGGSVTKTGGSVIVTVITVSMVTISVTEMIVPAGVLAHGHCLRPGHQEHPKNQISRQRETTRCRFFRFSRPPFTAGQPEHAIKQKAERLKASPPPANRFRVFRVFRGSTFLYPAWAAGCKFLPPRRQTPKGDTLKNLMTEIYEMPRARGRRENRAP